MSGKKNPQFSVHNVNTVTSNVHAVS